MTRAILPRRGALLALPAAAFLALVGCASPYPHSDQLARHARETAERCRAIINPRPAVTEAEWERTATELRQEAWPLLVQRLGLEHGTKEFERRVAALREAVQPGVAAAPDPYLSELCRQWIAGLMAPPPAPSRTVVVPVIRHSGRPSAWDDYRRRQAEMDAAFHRNEVRNGLRGIEHELREQGMQRRLDAYSRKRGGGSFGSSCSAFLPGGPGSC